MESNKTMQFYIDGNAVDSGSLFNILEGENLTLSTSCIPTDAQFQTFKCFIMIWDMDIWFGHAYQIVINHQLVPDLVSNGNCTELQIHIRHAELKLWIRNTIRRPLIVVGCHNTSAIPKKQVEFYLNILPPITYTVIDEKFLCSLQFSGNTLEVHALELSENQCFCNFTLVSCNPQVTVKHVQHHFACHPEMSSTKEEDVKLPTAWTTEQIKAIPIWVIFVVIAAVMTLLTVIVMVVVSCSRNKPSENVKNKAGQQSHSVSSAPKSTLDESLFKNRNESMEMDPESEKDQNSQKDVLSMKKLVYMGIPGAQSQEMPITVESQAADIK